MTPQRRFACLAIFIADAGFLPWGAMAALAPERLPGPGGAPILEAGYEGFTGGAWRDLVAASPKAAEFMTILFRVFGAMNVAFAALALAVTVTAFRRGERWAWWTLLAANAIGFGAPMTYDRTVQAIGPFEMLEYVGAVAVLAGLAVTAPFLAAGRPPVEASPTRP